MTEISILIIDDHPLFRQGVADVLALESNFKIVGTAMSGEDGLGLLRLNPPTIAIVDVNLPGMNGHQVTRQVVQERLGTRVILLTAYDDGEQRLQAMRAGACAYCSKDVEPEQLIRVIYSVAEGGYVLGKQVFDAAEMARWLESQNLAGLRLYHDPGDASEPLSAREMEVLAYVTRGLSNKEIANLLGISHQTVKNHVTAVLRKIGVEDRTQAAIYALRRGWVRLQQQNGENKEK